MEQNGKIKILVVEDDISLKDSLVRLLQNRDFLVQAVENINANEVPMDGSMAFFPKQDMSEIYVKGWNADGTIRTIVYKPYTDPKDNQTVNSMANAENAKFTLSDESTQLFLNKFEELSEKIGQLEDRFDKSLGTQRKTSKTQSKGGDEE